MIALLDNLDGIRVMILSSSELLDEIKISCIGGAAAIRIASAGPVAKEIMVRRGETLTISARRGLMKATRRTKKKGS